MGFESYYKKINLQLLPIKIHFFLFLAALACALPFRTIFAKQLGLSATAVGVIFFAVPFLRTLSNPLIGFVLDYFKRFRLTISVIVLIVALSHVAMVFIPPKDSEQAPRHTKDSDFHTRVHLFSGRSGQQMLFVSAYNGSMAGDIRFTCHVDCSTIEHSAASGEAEYCCDGKLNLVYQASVGVSKGEMTFRVPEVRFVEEVNKNDSLIFNSSHNLVFYEFPLIQGVFDRTSISIPLTVFNEYLNGSNFSLENANKHIIDFISSQGFDSKKHTVLFLSKLTMESAPLDRFSTNLCVSSLGCTTKSCSSVPSFGTDIISDAVKIKAGENEYYSAQFWALFILITISSQTLSAVMFLMDTVCYEMLQEKKEKYGQQRLWGTIGWGFGALAGGYLNDLVSLDADHIDYAPSFYLLAVISLIDLFIIFQLKVTDLKYSPNIWKDVCQLLGNIDILYNMFIIFFIGVLSGFIWNYQFWFMEEIGASQTLLGLSQVFECLSEVPWFIASGWIIKKIGHSNSNSLALLCFALRFLVFQLMYDPWMTLPAALLHGPTFGLFYASLTMYAKSEAPPGTEGTVQSLIHLSFEGVGAATGVILGGIGFDKVGSRTAFSYATRLSFLVLAVNLIATAVFYRLKRKTKSSEITPVDDAQKTSTPKRC